MIELLHPERDRERIEQLRGEGLYDFVDTWTHATAELSLLDQLDHIDPGTPAPERLDLNDPESLERRSRYAVFPWRRVVVRLPDSDTFYRLKTARNRFLLTSGEQDAWSHSLIAVAGLSVGSAALIACSLTGARRFHVADSDTVDLTNLNRMMSSVCDVGVSKIELSSRRILEGDPYSVITPFTAGYNPAFADEFLGVSGAQRVSVVIEEIDDVAMKIDLRRRARAAGIPVISTTDMGDNVILDIERYDLDPAYPIFHGRGESFTEGDATDPQQRLRMAFEIVGDALTPRMAFSASQIGRSIASWPQLGSTANMAGAIAAAAARCIVGDRGVPSGRFHFDVEKILLGASDTLGWNEIHPDVFAATLRARNPAN